MLMIMMRPKSGLKKILVTSITYPNPNYQQTTTWTCQWAFAMSKAQRFGQNEVMNLAISESPLRVFETLTTRNQCTWMSRLHKVVIYVYMPYVYKYKYIYIYIHIYIQYVCVYVGRCVYIVEKMCFLNYFIISLYLVMAWVCLLRCCSGARHSTYKQVISKRPPMLEE